MTDPTIDAPRSPVLYQPSCESLEEDETETVAQMKEALLKIAETVHRDEGHAYRAVHAKSHGLLLGQLQVLDNLPAVLAQGAFASARTIPVVMRFSTTPGDFLADSVSTSRGLEAWKA